jgi:hypothetical protein
LRLRRSRNLRSLGICAAITVGASLGVLAPAAMAAPTNDFFAQRADLGDALPVHIAESNVGATKESGEPRIGSLSNSGHSLWWEWQAPATEWVTASVCESSFLVNLNIFEGTELEQLKSLTAERGNGDEGPGCLESGTTYTFAATQGHDYVIGADGNSFYAPPMPGEEPHIPPGEGEIKLSLEATPVPPNDDFADSTRIGNNFQPVHQNPFEPPNDDRYFVEQTRGYNWGATKQEGEPDHAGDPGGASVWYAWKPTESGKARFSLQSAGGPKLLALYSGSSLDDLVPVASSPGPSPEFTANITAGTEYRIAVDGSRTEHPFNPFEGTSMGSFVLSVEPVLPPLPLPPPAEAQPTTTVTADPPAKRPAPTVKLDGHRVDTAAGTATFRFGSSTKGAKFTCAVDGKRYKACSSPFTARGLRPGNHVFRVLAGANGATGARPAVVHFTVPSRRRQKHAAG